jgi:hypothetical protein
MYWNGSSFWLERSSQTELELWWKSSRGDAAFSASGYLPYLNHLDASDLATWNQEHQAETMVSNTDRFFKCFKLTEEQESPHEHQQNLLLSRIITNVV